MGSTTQSKHEARVEDAAQKIIEMFTSGDMPAAIAHTVIARQDSHRPADRWSVGNQIIMMMHGTADARGYKQWKAVGRTVKKGAKAFYILAPRTRTITEENDDGTKTRKKITVGFTDAAVFRIEDTEGEPVVYPDYTPATLPPLANATDAFGVSVAYAPKSGNYYGLYAPSLNHIVLCTEDHSTFWHELAHAVDDKLHGPLKGGQQADQEIVAESAAAILSFMYTGDTTIRRSFDYVEHYAGQDNPAKAVTKHLSRILAIVNTILEVA